MQKRFENRFYDHIRVVVCKKRFEKTAKNESIFKMANIGGNTMAIAIQYFESKNKTS